MNAFSITSPFAPRAGSRLSSLALVAFAHVAVIYLLILSPARVAISNVSAFMVTLISDRQQREQVAPARPKSRPLKGQPIAADAVPLIPISATHLAADAASILPSAPLVTPAMPPVAAAMPDARVEPPQFDVAYLNNPTPVYPPMSKRLREQGNLLLRVWVSPNGMAEQIAIEMSSGSSRLDNAAIDAVSQWRFVPAKHGGIAVAGLALVPINFHLT